MVDENKGKLFEFFEEEGKVEIITGRKGKESEYEKALSAFVKSKKDKQCVRYHGKSAKLSGVAVTLRKKNKNVKIDIGKTPTGERVLVFSKVK